MIRFETLDSIEISENTGVALGTFDGLHIGHRQVLEELSSQCRSMGLKSLLFTFSNHPRELTHDSNNSSRIISAEEKANEIEKLGFDYIVTITFDESIKNIPAHDFIRDVLIKKLNARLVVVGYNFRFGRGAEGDVDTLRGYSDFFRVDIIPRVSSLHHLDVSSSSIREMLRDGDMERAAEILGRPYKLVGTVDFGRRVGRSLGFPTANLSISLEMTVIKSGVYATRTTVGSVTYPSVTNVGVNPTFMCDSVDKCRRKGSSQNAKPCEGECEGMFSIETHIIGFEGDIYGKTIEVEFVKRIRDEERFSSPEELIEQIRLDVQTAKTLLYTE